MAASVNTPVCPDWVFLNNSNVHVAKDRGWFKTYTPFTSTVGNIHFGGSTPVLGIGTVEIPTKRSPHLSGVSSHASLHLKQVLHVPSFICNVLGASAISDGYKIQTDCSQAKLGTVKDGQGRNVAYFDPKRPLFTIKVRNSPQGPKLGPHALQKGEMYMLSCRWPRDEQQRWQDYQAGNGLINRESTSTTDTTSPYTDEEKNFLKTNWGNEYRFLVQHGLHIHREEDRAEGRSILRALMHEDQSSDEEEEESDSDFEGHQVDYAFTQKQLDWIKEHYGNAEQFMISYGLRFYNDEHVEEAKYIVDAMMRDDDD